MRYLWPDAYGRSPKSLEDAESCPCALKSRLSPPHRPKPPAFVQPFPLRGKSHSPSVNKVCQVAGDRFLPSPPAPVKNLHPIRRVVDRHRHFYLQPPQRLRFTRLLIKCSSPHKQGEASEIIRPPSTSEPRLTSDRQLGKVPNDVPWTLQRRPAPERDLMAQRADGLVCTAEPARASSAGLDLVSPSHRSITTQQTELIRH